MSDDDLVWHYTDGAGLLAILSGHQLWATSSAFLNDAAEMVRGLELLGDMIARRAETEGGLFAELARHVSEVDPRRSVTAPFFILSASQSPDSLAMWRTYGRARESYAIGLDASAPLSVLGSGQDGSDVVVRRRPWESIAYDRAAQEDLVARVLDGFPSRLPAIKDELGAATGDRAATWSRLSASPAFMDVLEDLERAVLLIKDRGFHEELETRYAVAVYPASSEPADPGRTAELVQFRVSPYGVAPYLRLTGSPPGTDAVVTTEPHPLPVRAVSISPSPNGAAAEESLRAFLLSVGHDVPVHRSGIPFRQ